MAMPYDLTLSDGSRRQLYGPWRVDAAAELVVSRRRAGQPLCVAATARPAGTHTASRSTPLLSPPVADRVSGAVVNISA